MTNIKLHPILLETVDESLLQLDAALSVDIHQHVLTTLQGDVGLVRQAPASLNTPSEPLTHQPELFWFASSSRYCPEKDNNLKIINPALSSCPLPGYLFSIIGLFCVSPGDHDPKLWLRSELSLSGWLIGLAEHSNIVEGGRDDAQVDAAVKAKVGLLGFTTHIRICFSETLTSYGHPQPWRARCEAHWTRWLPPHQQRCSPDPLAWPRWSGRH